MPAPAEVLISRALHFLEGAQLYLDGGDVRKAAEKMEQAIALLKELTTR